MGKNFPSVAQREEIEVALTILTLFVLDSWTHRFHSTSKSESLVLGNVWHSARISFWQKNLQVRENCNTLQTSLYLYFIQAVTGGYRRVPIVQFGNNIYCDTRLIVRFLDSLSPRHTLCSLKPIVNVPIDELLMFTRMIAIRGRELGSLMDPIELKSFAVDRAEFFRRSTVVCDFDVRTVQSNTKHYCVWGSQTEK